MLRVRVHYAHYKLINVIGQYREMDRKQGCLTQALLRKCQSCLQLVILDEIKLRFHSNNYANKCAMLSQHCLDSKIWN